MATASDTAELGSGDTIFAAAKDQFLETISEKERLRFAECTSVEQLLAEVQTFNISKQDQRKHVIMIEHIHKFGASLQPYFKILNIVVQSHPEWSAIVWGAVRLVLQLASNFVTFFEKLTALLELLARLMPDYAEVLEISMHGNHQISDRLRSSLQDLYVDLFGFLTAVASVFTQKSGKSKCRPLVVGTLFWQPFDTKFENFLKRLEFHNQVLSQEKTILQLRIQVSSSAAQAEEQKMNEEFRAQSRAYFELVKKLDSAGTFEQHENSYTKIRDWLNPPKYIELYEDSSSLRLDGTAQWIFNEPLFQQWKNKASTSETGDQYQDWLWVKGNPGSGKTVLAAATVQELRNSSNELEIAGSVSCFYFFSYRYTGTRTLNNAYRSILAQILRQCRNDKTIVDVYLFAVSNAQSSNSKNELLGLLKAVLSRLRDVSVVIDGLDECEQPDEVIKSLSNAAQGCNAKIIIFSRPNVHTLMKAPGLRTINMSRESVEPDLRLYFSRQVLTLQDDGLLSYACSCEELVPYLLAGANGMFMWARLMIIYLESPALVEASRLASIRSINHPERLGEMYIRILHLITCKIKEEQELARRIFTWLTCSQRNLTVRQMQDVLVPLEAGVSTNGTSTPNSRSSTNFGDFQYTVVMVCGSLVEVAHGSCHFIHQSALEFFKDSFTSSETFDQPDSMISKVLLPPWSEVQSELTSTCLTYLLFRVPAQPLSGNIHLSAPKDHIDTAFPFLGYASVFWTTHLHEIPRFVDVTLSKSKTSLGMFHKLLGIMSLFLNKKRVLMSWVETLYTFARKDELKAGYVKMQEWSRDVQSLEERHIQPDIKDMADRLSAFAEDLIMMDDYWAQTLHAGPHQIWNDITAFTPSPFFQSTSATSVTSLAAIGYGNSLQSSKPLASISTETNDSKAVGVLSVWPSRMFESSWKDSSLSFLTASMSADEIFAGWTARFEIWNTEAEEPQRLQDYYIALDESEIELHVRSYLNNVKSADKKGNASRYRPPKLQSRPALPFPMVISQNFEVLIVLKTVYVLVPSTIKPSQNQGLRDCPWRSVLIPTGYSNESEPANDSREEPRKRRAKVSTSEKKSEFRVSYAYQCQISKDNRYVLYQDTAGLSFLPSSNIFTSITVFELDITGTEACCRSLGHIGGDGARTSISSCSFHEELPLLIFHNRSFTSGSGIMLWSFIIDQSMPSSSNDEINCFDDTIAMLWPGFKGIEYLNFSRCGTQVVFKIGGQLLHEVLSIESNPVYQHALKVASNRSFRSAQGHLRTKDMVGKQDEQDLMADSSSLQLGMNIGDGPTTYNLAVSSSGSRREIEVTRQSNATEETQPLVALPNWPDIDKIDVSVRAPAAGDSKIKMVLNKAAQPWYSLTDEQDTHLPAIVRKEVGALGPSRKRNATGETIYPRLGPT